MDSFILFLKNSNAKNNIHFPEALLTKKQAYTDEELVAVWFFAQVAEYFTRYELKTTFKRFTSVRYDVFTGDAESNFSSGELGMSSQVFSFFRCALVCYNPTLFCDRLSGDSPARIEPKLRMFTDADYRALITAIWEGADKKKSGYSDAMIELGKVEQVLTRVAPENVTCPKHVNEKNAIRFDQLVDQVQVLTQRFKELELENKEMYEEMKNLSEINKTLEADNRVKKDRIHEQDLELYSYYTRETPSAVVSQQDGTVPAEQQIDYLTEFKEHNTLNFLADDQVEGLLSQYDPSWRKTISCQSTTTERVGTMEYMARTMILDQILGHAFDQEMITYIVPERKCMIKEISESISRSLSLDASAFTYVKNIHGMMDKLYCRLVSQGDLKTDKVEDLSVQTTLVQSAVVSAPIQDRAGPSMTAPSTSAYVVKPPPKPGFMIIEIDDGYVYIPN